MNELSEISIQFEGGTLTCIGHLDTLDAVPEAMDGDTVWMNAPNGFKIQVVKDGEIRVDDQSPVPLPPGVYRSTDCGLVSLEGAPVYGSPANQG